MQLPVNESITPPPPPQKNTYNLTVSNKEKKTHAQNILNPQYIYINRILKTNHFDQSLYIHINVTIQQDRNIK